MPMINRRHTTECEHHAGPADAGALDPPTHSKVTLTGVTELQAAAERYTTEVEGRPLARPMVRLAGGAEVEISCTMVELVQEARAIVPTLSSLPSLPRSIVVLPDHPTDITAMMAPYIAFDLEARLTVAETVRHGVSADVVATEAQLLQAQPDLLIASAEQLARLKPALVTRGTFAAIVEGLRHVVLTDPPDCYASSRSSDETWGSPARHLRYAPSGVHSVALPCAAGQLHLLARSRTVAELLDGDDTPLPAVRGTTGELVVTALGSQATVMLRYRTGDIVRLDRCSCGSINPAVSVTGRVPPPVAAPE